MSTLVVRDRARCLLLPLAAVGLLAAGCGDPNAGDAAEVEAEAFLDANPVAGYEAEIGGNNTLPFSGTLSITMVAQDPAAVDRGGDLDEMTSVAEQVCDFDPEASVSVELAYRAGRVTVPLACPDSTDGADLLVDQAALFADLRAVRGIAEVEATTGQGAYVEARVTHADDVQRVTDELEALVLRHTLALGDEDPYVRVGGPVTNPPSSPAPTPPLPTTTPTPK